MKAITDIREILMHFGVDFFESGGKLSACCPIHDGDNPGAFNINVDETDQYYGAWFCNTGRCHEDTSNDVLGLVLALLQVKDEKAGFPEVVQFVERFCKSEVSHVSSINKFLSQKEDHVKKVGIGRAEVRRRLIIPAQYYLNRKFDPKTLDYFDVGYCNTPNTPMYGRVVFPVYDEDDDTMIGCVGRTTGKHKFKWINSKGFSKSKYLYNYAKAIRRGRETGTLILVEGQGDVMRLHEAGVYNAVGLFGCHLSDSQQIMLERSGILNVVLMLDMDKAGQEGRDDILKKCSRLFNIVEVNLSSKDVGAMSPEQVRSEVLTGLENYV